ncbi:MAG TPA: hypothetical protein PLW67_08415 [Prolixibacteraceae bacterium]|nr:hypothetical protein [Prolixibacteraceae bacterium]
MMNTLRICLVGGTLGPDLFRILEILGKTETVARIRTAAEKINI